MEQIKEIKNLLNSLEVQLNDNVTIERAFEKPWIYDTSLTAHQRVILTIMVDKSEDGHKGCRQGSLVKASGFSNKNVRESLQALAVKNYVRRGIKAGTWYLA